MLLEKVKLVTKFGEFSYYDLNFQGQDKASAN